jgi:hypothetical protein
MFGINDFHDVFIFQVIWIDNVAWLSLYLSQLCLNAKRHFELIAALVRDCLVLQVFQNVFFQVYIRCFDLFFINHSLLVNDASNKYNQLMTLLFIFNNKDIWNKADA